MIESLNTEVRFVFANYHTSGAAVTLEFCPSLTEPTSDAEVLSLT